MNVLVVYDSYFGNTEKIAQEVGRTMGEDVPVKRPEMVYVEELSELDVLIVGAPTRAFQPSDAIKKFLKDIPNGGLEGVKIAAFDTRMDPDDVGNIILKFMVKIFGFAAEPIAKALEKKGGLPVGEPAGFIVLDSEGPLREGEMIRAQMWAENLKN
jgi:flavodoxin